MEVPSITVEELYSKQRLESPLIVDIRDKHVFEEGHIDGATHLDDASSQNFLENTAKDLMIVVYCYHGNSSQLVVQWLLGHGYQQVFNLEGGYDAWKNLLAEK